ncbi:MAG: hypothetical protein LBN27_02125 [Prevotellaceae bacterium]|jgi:hypothetical protein|nr:hypothetical protein [Prevotellaceae bacterium]
METITKIIAAIVGAALAYFEPTFPFLLVCTTAVILDAFFAWRLSRRVRQNNCSKGGKTSCGKFKSFKFARIFINLINIYLVIVLSFMIEKYIFEGLEIRLVNIVSGAVCFWQLWSILENESSCNNAKWAQIAQKIMIDKTERHFDVDLSDLKEKEEKNAENH